MRLFYTSGMRGVQDFQQVIHTQTGISLILDNSGLRAQYVEGTPSGMIDPKIFELGNRSSKQDDYFDRDDGSKSVIMKKVNLSGEATGQLDNIISYCLNERKPVILTEQDAWVLELLPESVNGVSKPMWENKLNSSRS